MLDVEGKRQLAGSLRDLDGVFAFFRKLAACSRQATCENELPCL